MLDMALFVIRNMSNLVANLFTIQLVLTDNVSVSLGSMFVFMFLIFMFIKLILVLTNTSTINNSGGIKK